MDRIDTNRSKIALSALRAGAAAPVERTVPVRKADTAVKSAADAAMTSLVSAGEQAPVDGDRVAVIRKAVEDGRYPVVPARIADALIAAGYLLRTKG